MTQALSQKPTNRLSAAISQFHKRVLRSISRSESMELLKSGATYLAPLDAVEVHVNGRLIAKATVPFGCDGVLAYQLRLERQT